MGYFALSVTTFTTVLPDNDLEELVIVHVSLLYETLHLLYSLSKL